MNKDKHIKNPDFIPDIEEESTFILQCVLWGGFIIFMVLVAIAVISFIVNYADQIDAII